MAVRPRRYPLQEMCKLRPQQPIGPYGGTRRHAAASRVHTHQTPLRAHCTMNDATNRTNPTRMEW